MRLNLSMLLITMHIQVYRREKIPEQMLIAFIDKMFYKGNKSEVQSASSRLYLSICFDPQSFMYHKPCQCYYVKQIRTFGVDQISSVQQGRSYQKILINQEMSTLTERSTAPHSMTTQFKTYIKGEKKQLICTIERDLNLFWGQMKLFM